jgi:hypothetical protein
MQATATIQTPNARRYLGQFCKHFAHKLPVELDPAYASGKVPFGPLCVPRRACHHLESPGLMGPGPLA